jgi:uncharacterized protein (DUF1501 family)
MDRRTFIKAASCAGITVAGPTAFAEDQVNKLMGKRQSDAAYTGVFYMTVHCGGGWDPTSLCDPKGAAYEDAPDRMNNYLTADIETAGNLRYAPSPIDGNPHNVFFQRHYDKILVVNGIDMMTNGHDAGVRHTWSGRLSEGHPSTAAFIAGAYDPAAPMAFTAFGGFQETGGLVPRTRAGDIGPLLRAAYPDRMDPDDEASLFHSEQTGALIRQYQGQREEAMIANMGLPKIREAMRTLFTARSGSNELKLLQQYLPDPLPDGTLQSQAAVALAAYRAGIAISANLSIGGFDTHGNHDAGHFPRMAEVVEGLGYILDEVERMGIADKVVVMIGSDFGRTPGYNDGNGKDHWPVTSMMFMGAGIKGNRVVGQTDERHGRMGFDINTLQPLSGEDAPRLHPGHINKTLRAHAGLRDHEYNAMFFIEEEEVPALFTG